MDYRSDITADNIRPFVEAFFEKTTEEQWELLKEGQPDNATKLLLAQLLLDIMATVSSAMLKALRRTNSPLSQESVRSNLADTLVQSLSLGSPTESKGLDRLTDLVAEEVTMTVQSNLSAISNSTSAEDATPTHISNPGIIQRMIKYICKVFKAAAEKIKGIFKFRSSTRSRLSSQNTPEQSSEVDATPVSYSSSESNSSSSFSSRCRSESAISTGSTMTSSEVVQSIISKEVNDITEPILGEVPDDEYNMLHAEFTSEIKCAADDIAHSISEESPKDQASLSSQKDIVTEKGKIARLFTKTFASASLLQILMWIKMKFKTRRSSREAIKSLMDCVETVLLNEEKSEGIESPALETLKTMPSEKVLVFTQELTNSLYENAVTDMDALVPQDALQAVAVHHPQRNMLAEIQYRVQNFLSLMRWWLNKQADSHTNTVTEALITSQSTTAGEKSVALQREKTSDEASDRTSEGSSEHTSSEIKSLDGEDIKLKELYKMYLILFVDKLITRIYDEAGLSMAISNAQEKVIYLREKIWTEIKDIELAVDPDTLKDLDKDIFKELLKEWTSPEMIMISLYSEEPELERFITSSLTHRLTKKNPGFFSFMTRLFHS